MLRKGSKGRRLLIGLVMVAAVACLTPAQTIRGSGNSPLSVTVASTSGTPITSVSCETFSSEEWAKSGLEYLIPPETLTHSIVAYPFVGKPLVVQVPIGYTTHSALVWSWSRYSQMRWLLVIVQFHDGRREGQVVAIPDLREERSIRVEFP